MVEPAADSVHEKCAFCSRELAGGETPTGCPRCGAKHHAECFGKLGHCARCQPPPQTPASFAADIQRQPLVVLLLVSVPLVGCLGWPFVGVYGALGLKDDEAFPFGFGTAGLVCLGGLLLLRRRGSGAPRKRWYGPTPHERPLPVTCANVVQVLAVLALLGSFLLIPYPSTRAIAAALAALMGGLVALTLGVESAYRSVSQTVPERERAEEPLLVLEGHYLPHVRLAQGAFELSWIAPLIGLRAAASSPWSWPALTSFADRHDTLVFFGVLVATIPVRSRVRDRLRARAGRTELYAESIVIESSDSLLQLPWIGVRAFDDGESDHVVLVDSTGRRIGVPTLTESGRTRLLAFLVENGLRRLER